MAAITEVSIAYLDGKAPRREYRVRYWLEDGEHETTALAVDRHDAEQIVRDRFTEPTLCLAD